MNRVLIIGWLALCCLPLVSQTLAKNDALKLDADYYLMDKNFSKALGVYLNILKSEPDNADIKYKVGICYLNSENEKSKAISYLEQASEKISEKYNANSFKEMNAPVDALFLLGSAYRVSNQIDKALETYRKYRNYVDPRDEYNINVIDQYIRNCELAGTMMQNPVNLSATNMGAPVNTIQANFNAVVSGDGKSMLYTSPGRLGYDIFFTEMKDDQWTTPKNISSVLGSDKYMVTSDLSNDGLTLLLALDDPVNSDIFMSHYNRGRWSKAEPLSKEINSKYNETHASLSSDGKTLYFTSDRKGGQGDLDIYKSELDSKGEWTKAVNLGPNVNTQFNEETPFVSDDGQLLYFSSEGHNGIGGYDIYCFDFNKQAAGPVNMGYPLNTTDHDLFYNPVGNGRTAYYAFKGEDSQGGRDIYKVFVPEKVEEPVLAEETETVMPEMVATEELQIPETTVAEIIPEVQPVIPEPNPVTAEPMVTEPVITEPAMTEPAVTEPVVNEPPNLTQVPVQTDYNPESSSIEESPAGQTVNSFGVNYKIQLLAVKRPVDLAYFDKLKGVAVRYSSDNWYRYTIGNMSDRLVAEKLLNELIGKGYKDAFIRNCNVNPQFTIQVMAVPGPVVNLSRFGNLNEVSVTRGEDRFCRYTTGEFATKQEALADLPRVKSLGYKKAFVTQVHY